MSSLSKRSDVICKDFSKLVFDNKKGLKTCFNCKKNSRYLYHCACHPTITSCWRCIPQIKCIPPHCQQTIKRTQALRCLCKYCHKRKSTVIFEKCYHSISCYPCFKKRNIQRCPICKKYRNYFFVHVNIE
jgi:hypothetical protein